MTARRATLAYSALSATWVYVRRAPRGQPARDHRDAGEQPNHAEVSDRVQSRDAEQQCHDGLARRHGPDQPDAMPKPVSVIPWRTTSARMSPRDAPSADRTPISRVRSATLPGENPVDAGCRQHQRHERERLEQDQREAPLGSRRRDAGPPSWPSARSADPYPPTRSPLDRRRERTGSARVRTTSDSALIRESTAGGWHVHRVCSLSASDVCFTSPTTPTIVYHGRRRAKVHALANGIRRGSFASNDSLISTGKRHAGQSPRREGDRDAGESPSSRSSLG